MMKIFSKEDEKTVWLDELAKDGRVNPMARGLQVRHQPLWGVWRAIGFITTPFKLLGIAGWLDLGVYGEVTGVVYQDSAWSTDGYTTVDLDIQSLQVYREEVTCSYVKPADKAFEAWIRVEIKPWVKPPWQAAVPGGTKVSIRGKIMVDHDNFYEIHPEKISDIRG